jgi:hypothetical protein
MPPTPAPSREPLDWSLLTRMLAASGIHADDCVSEIVLDEPCNCYVSRYNARRAPLAPETPDV